MALLRPYWSVVCHALWVNQAMTAMNLFEEGRDSGGGGTQTLGASVYVVLRIVNM